MLVVTHVCRECEFHVGRHCNMLHTATCHPIPRAGHWDLSFPDTTSSLCAVPIEGNPSKFGRRGNDACRGRRLAAPCTPTPSPKPPNCHACTSRLLPSSLSCILSPCACTCVISKGKEYPRPTKAFSFIFLRDCLFAVDTLMKSSKH